MPEAIFLDTGPLGLLVKRPEIPEVAACRQWLANCLSARHDVYLPEIADYELRRELLQRGFTESIVRLDLLKRQLIYLPLTTDAMLLAADLWAQVRRGGKTTADPHALDGDVILAAQMLSTGLPDMSMIAATTNTKHLVRFVHCGEWQHIRP